MTQEDKQEFMKKIEELTPVNRNNLLAYTYGIHAAQENTKQDIRRQYGLSPEGYPAQAGQAARSAEQQAGAGA